MSSLKLGRYRIYSNVEYFISYAGGQRGLSKKDQTEYNKATSIPFGISRAKELYKLDKRKNPNVIPVMGIKIMEFIIDKKLIPFFDPNFEQTKTITMTDLVIFESLKTQKYNIKSV